MQKQRMTSTERLAEDFQTGVQMQGMSQQIKFENLIFLRNELHSVQQGKNLSCTFCKKLFLDSKEQPYPPLFAF